MDAMALHWDLPAVGGGGRGRAGSRTWREEGRPQGGEEEGRAGVTASKFENRC